MRQYQVVRHFVPLPRTLRLALSFHCLGDVPRCNRPDHCNWIGIGADIDRDAVRNAAHGHLYSESRAAGASISVTGTVFSLADVCPGTVLDASLAVTGFICSVPTGGTITGTFVVGGAQPPGALTLTLTGRS